MTKGRVWQPTGNIERASATTSDNNMVQLAGLRVNETATYNSDGSLKEVNSIELTAGWGVNRMFVDVAAISYAGLEWVMVVALQQSMLLEKIQHLQVRRRACGVVCVRVSTRLIPGALTMPCVLLCCLCGWLCDWLCGYAEHLLPHRRWLHRCDGVHRGPGTCLQASRVLSPAPTHGVPPQAVARVRKKHEAQVHAHKVAQLASAGQGLDILDEDDDSDDDGDILKVLSKDSLEDDSSKLVYEVWALSLAGWCSGDGAWNGLV